MKYKIHNDELGYIAAYEFNNLEDAAHEAAIKCRKHSVVAVDEDGTIHKMWHNWKTRKWEFPTHQANCVHYKDGSFHYYVSEYGEGSGEICMTDFENEEIEKIEYCVVFGNSESVNEFANFENYGCCLER